MWHAGERIVGHSPLLCSANPVDPRRTQVLPRHEFIPAPAMRHSSAASGHIAARLATMLSRSRTMSFGPVSCSEEARCFA